MNCKRMILMNGMCMLLTEGRRRCAAVGSMFTKAAEAGASCEFVKNLRTMVELIWALTSERKWSLGHLIDNAVWLDVTLINNAVWPRPPQCVAIYLSSALRWML